MNRKSPGGGHSGARFARVFLACLAAVAVLAGCQDTYKRHEAFDSHVGAFGHVRPREGYRVSTAEVLARGPSGVVVDGVRVVEVTARRFSFSPDVIVVNEGEHVLLQITSQDVIHGFALAGYRIERRLLPHMTETIRFTADRPGHFGFHCSVYCGIRHGDMAGTLLVAPYGYDARDATRQRALAAAGGK